MEIKYLNNNLTGRFFRLNHNSSKDNEEYVSYHWCNGVPFVLKSSQKFVKWDYGKIISAETKNFNSQTTYLELTFDLVSYNDIPEDQRKQEIPTFITLSSRLPTFSEIDYDISVSQNAELVYVMDPIHMDNKSYSIGVLLRGDRAIVTGHSKLLKQKFTFIITDKEQLSDESS